MLRTLGIHYRALALALLLLAVGLSYDAPKAFGQAPQAHLEKLDAALRRHLPFQQLGLAANSLTRPAASGVASLQSERSLPAQAVLRREAAAKRMRELDFAYSPSDKTVRALIKTDGSLDGLDELGITVQSTIGDVSAVRIPVGALAALTVLPKAR